MVKKNDKRRQQHVQLLEGQQDDDREAGSTASLNGSIQASRLSFSDAYTVAVEQALAARMETQIMQEDGEELTNVTPALLFDSSFKPKFSELIGKIKQCESVLPIKVASYQRAASVMDATQSLVLERDSLPTLKSEALDDGQQSVASDTQRVQPYIKIMLRKTKEMLFFEQRSITVPRDSQEAQLVEAENRHYDYITVGKGRQWRRNNSEAQTTDVLRKSRDVNTKRIDKNAVVSYVSNFEMFDTYRNLECTTKSIDVGDAQKMNVTTYKVGGVDQFEAINKSGPFKVALMITTRVLAGNIFEQEQRRYRNMVLPDPFATDVMFTYSLIELFEFNLAPADNKRRAIVDIAFCPRNGDIIAVAYGMYSYGIMQIPEESYCCIWNIKNPKNPERVYVYENVVVSVEFSPSRPELLAIGLFDGAVEIRNITDFDKPPIAVSQRTEQSTCDPITAMRFLTHSGSDTSDIDQLLAMAQEGSVTKYRIINGPHLLAFPQMQLDRVEGSPEGLYMRRPWHRTLSSRCPQGVNMVLHPRQHDLYFLLTDEGCIHKCSTNYPHQHLDILQVHNGPVTSMDFSPWSPKLFLTAGNDWHIRIWIEGIFDPLISLTCENSPVLSAAWSRTHSTILISNTRKAIYVWDIRRSVLKPVSVVKIEHGLHTLFKISLCGRSIAMGKESGTVSIMALENFPFPPHFQYDELELAIYKAISTKPEVTQELKGIGYFGYPPPDKLYGIPLRGLIKVFGAKKNHRIITSAADIALFKGISTLKPHPLLSELHSKKHRN